MIKVFSRFTALIVWVLAVVVFNPTQTRAAVGDTFTSDQLKYTVLTEEDTLGTAAVSGYVDAPTTITIPGSVSHEGKTYSVTSLGDDAFSWCDSLTTLTIPASVTTIAQSAFSACFSLEQVYYEGNVPETQPGLYDAAPDTLISYYKAANKISWELVIVDGKWQDRSIVIRFTEGLQYQYNDDGTASVTGIGSATDTDILIPSTVINLKKTYIVASIENNAFFNCTNLASITIPDSVTSIGNRVFWHCNSLTSIIIPDSITSISDMTFHYCSNLTSIVIPDSVTSIGSYAFSYCSSLISITIPDSVTSIGHHAFYYCNSLTNVVIPDSVTSIDPNAFEYCISLISITIPESITSIENRTFSHCSSLTNIVIPDSVILIGGSAFSGCSSLTRVVIPGSVISIEDYAFFSCSKLTNIYFEGDAPRLGGSSVFADTINIIDLPPMLTVYYLDGTTGWTNPWGGKPTVQCAGWDTQDGVVYIHQSNGTASVVDYVGKSETVIISEIISIDSTNYSVTSIGNKAFYECTNLTSITIPDSVTFIGEKAFYKCNNLTNITLSDNVTSIGESAFSRCSSLTNITIPDSLTEIGNYAFYECSSLNNIIIPDGVASIGDLIFYGCNQLPPILFSTGEKILFRYSPSNTLTSYVIPDTVIYIAGGAFYSCDTLLDITIPNSITSICNSTFYGCSNLTNIVIPDSVTSIGYDAFYSCSSLINITISDNLTSIGDWAFSHCEKLTSITIPDSVTSIGSCIFTGCNSLKEINVESNNQTYSSIDGVLFDKNQTVLIQYPAEKKDVSYSIPDNVTSIGVDAFSDCVSLKRIMIPDSVFFIGNSAFLRCGNLTNITIPDSVVSIGNNAFYNCSSLDHVYFKGDAPIIGYSVFSNTKATIYYLEGTEGWTNPWGERPTVAISPVIYNYNYHSDGTATVTGVSEEVIFFDEIKIPSTVEKDGVTYTVTAIAEKAFYENEILTRVVVPDSVTTIGTGAFSNCANLVSVTVGKGVTSIGNGAFFGCGSLTEIYFDGDAPELGRQAFFNTPATIYYQAGTEGWTDPWGDRPTVMIREEVPVLTCALEGDMIRLQWTADADAVLQVSDDAVDDWTDVTEGIQTESGSCVYKVPATAKQAFYRLKMP